MARAKGKAEATAEPSTSDPTEFVGRNDRGAVRPADDRYLTPEQIAARDAYVLEVTGPEAQQIQAAEAKRQAADDSAEEGETK